MGIPVNISTRCTRALGACIAVMLTGRAFTAHSQRAYSSALQQMREVTVSHSASGRFAASSRDPALNLDLLRWAEQLAERFERTTGLTPYLSRKGRFHIVIQDADNDDDTRPTIRNELNGLDLQQSLTIHNYKNTDLGETAERFCSLLLHGLVTYRWMSAKQATESKREASVSPRPAPVPEWLSWGVAENLLPDQRFRHRIAMLERWNQKELRPLSRLLLTGMPPPRASANGQPDKAVAALLVAWILDEDPQGTRLSKLLDLLASGERLAPGRVAMALSSGATGQALDDQWETWIRKQRLVVRIGPPLAPLTELRAALLLCPGESGIPLNQGLAARMTFDDLVAFREATWMKGCARIKSTELHVMGLNKDEDFQSVLAAYRTFLRAMEERKSTAELKTLLMDAHLKRRAYEQRAEQEQ